MNLFCLLFVPLLYLLRRSPGRENNLWALFLGAAAVAIWSLSGPLVNPGGFGLSRWMSGFIDIVGLPALLPLIVCGVLVLLRVFPRRMDYAGFALLHLVPLAAARSVSGTSPAPLPLVAVPLLWAAQAVGIPFFISAMVNNPRGHIVFFAVIAIAALPVAAVSSWWAFFSHQTLLGALLLAASLVPTVIAITVNNREQITVNREQITVNRAQ